jgi:hypothetical protein
MADRTTKILLACLALGLWSNMFVTVLRPTAVSAQYESDYVLKDIDARVARIESSVGGMQKGGYLLQSMDAHLARIEAVIARVQKDACASGKSCL